VHMCEVCSETSQRSGHCPCCGYGFARHGVNSVDRRSVCEVGRRWGGSVAFFKEAAAPKAWQVLQGRSSAGGDLQPVKKVRDLFSDVLGSNKYG
jgi:hypothetical protein